MLLIVPLGATLPDGKNTCKCLHNERFRRLLIRWEKKTDNYVAMLHFACAYSTLRAAGVLG